MEVIRADIVIVGGGGAGLRAAIAAQQADPGLKVALLSKVVPMRSHTVAAEGGSAGVVRGDDSLANHFDDTVSGGDWLCDQDAVQYFVEHCTEEMVQLEHWGCPWSRHDDGSINVRFFGGMKVQRTWFAADKSGFHILHTLFQTSLRFGGIQRYDEFFVADLLVDDGRVRGVLAIEIATGQFYLFEARAVILATGGAGRVYRQNTNAGIVTGDGMALAFRHGVALRDMEFVQYHPTALPGTGILITEGCRGEGAILTNKHGYRYLQDYGLGPLDPWPRPKAMELGPRDRLSQAFWHEERKGNTIATPQGHCVHLDLRHLGAKKIHERLPLITEVARTFLGASTRSPPPFRCGRRCTTPWAASTPTATRRRRCRGCTRPANVPAWASTAPTGWGRTRWPRSWCSARWPARRPRPMRVGCRMSLRPRCGARPTTRRRGCWRCWPTNEVSVSPRCATPWATPWKPAWASTARPAACRPRARSWPSCARAGARA
jgi:fumarate reductase flavoprotein subunit